MVFHYSYLPENLQGRNIKRIGFPRLEQYDMSLLLQQDGYREAVRNNLIDTDDEKVPENIKNNTEFVLDISGDRHKLEVLLKPNYTRAEEQKKVWEEVIHKEKENGTYDERIDKNVVIIYIDNISRAHFIRKMKKTVKWLEQYVDNEESDYTTYQYTRYHSSMYATSGNNAALFYGQFRVVADAHMNMFDSYSK